MTSPQPPRPHSGIAGAAIDEETLHLPLTTPGPASTVRPTAPSPYPQRPPFQPAPAPAPPRPQRRPERWEGTGFRPDIQGLRAIAVVLVLLSHAGFSFAEGGYVGVDVFFVVSGFLITSLLIKEVFDTGRISISGFYARRARRILPAASAVTIVTALAAWLWFPVTRLEAVMQDAFTVIVYVINYRFVAESAEYLNAGQMPSPFQQYWSLAVEEQFYVVWPLLLLGLLLAMKRAPRRMLNLAITVCVVIFVLSLIASVLITDAAQSTAYYAAHTRAWELAGGAFLALTLQTWKKLPSLAALALGVVGLAAIVASGVLYTEQTPFPGYTALLPVLGTMLVIVAGTARGENLVSSLLATGPFQFVGKISYSLYLWHWPILILGPLAIGAEPGLLLNVVLLAGTFAVAQLSYEYIETPFRTAKLLKGNIMGLATGVLCSLLAVAMILTLTLGFSKTAEESGPVDLEAVEEVEDLTALEQQLSDGLEIEQTPEGLTPPLSETEADRPVTYGDGCHLDTGTVELPEGCAYGDTDSDTQVVLFGDSHAAQWFPALEAIASEQGWSLINRTKSSCTPVSVRMESDVHEGEYVECWDWKAEVFDEIDEIQPEMVVLGSSDAVDLSGPNGDEATAWANGWTETLERIGESAGTTVALTDTPWATGEFSGPDCISLNSDAVSTCVSEEPYAIVNEDFRAAGLEAQEAAGATVIDTEQWLCLDGKCPVIVGDISVYRDKHHMSTPYARSLTGVLFEALPAI
ncbi:acyltransferase family protein [Glycomyces tenuis]|uniref:acyltransferase family protein n=1 Tax=Glycomyces tenuis TaxID=58116 RepID=UPI0003FE3DB7|nr:acyltransferase family protein [Glycomyces tenuis]